MHHLRRSPAPTGSAHASSADADGVDSTDTAEHQELARSVFRGGAVNMVAALIYGISSFVLLLAVDHGLAPGDAGVVLIGIAVFNVLARVCELGAATGLIRQVSRLRAVGRSDLLAATAVVALVPVVVFSTLVAIVLAGAAGSMAGWFTHGAGGAGVAEGVRRVLVCLAPLLPVAVAHSVLVQGTRGFDTMVPQAAIEKIGRGLLMPVVVVAAARSGAGPVGVTVAWAATNVAALVGSAWTFAALVGRHRNNGRNGSAPAVAPSGVRVRHAREFWSFAAPRAMGQSFEIAINWADTLIVGALISTTAAGIYASGTRYLLVGTFAAEAVMQVMGPRVSGLLAAGRVTEVERLVAKASEWQTTVTWPAFLLIIGFAPTLLGVFGAHVVAAQGALIALSVAMLVSALVGPASSVVLMSGRSAMNLANACIGLLVNLVSNFLLVPRIGITGAGLAWAATLLMGTLLPAWQAHRHIGVNTFSWSAPMVAARALATVGTAVLVARITVGATWPGLFGAAIVGGSCFMWAQFGRQGSRLRLSRVSRAQPTIGTEVGP